MDITELNRISDKNNFCRHPWEITRARIIKFLIKKNKEKPGHIVDIGSGDGYVLQALADQKASRDYTAIDNAYTGQIINKLKLSWQEPVTFFSSFEHAVTHGISGDCVLLTDVLEHCEDDKELLDSIVQNKILSDDGFLLVTVPAYQQLFSEHDQLLHHYRRYTRKQIIELCKSSNLKAEVSGFFFFSLIPARIFQLFSQKLNLLKTKKSIDNWNGNAIITKLISFILWTDFRMCYALSKIGIHIPGLSCYCICKRMPS